MKIIKLLIIFIFKYRKKIFILVIGIKSMKLQSNSNKIGNIGAV